MKTRPIVRPVSDEMLATLAHEGMSHVVADLTAAAEQEHLDWVESVFAGALPADAAPRSALVDPLVVATDVYAGKLLHRDRGLGLDDVHARMRATIDGVTTARA